MLPESLPSPPPGPAGQQPGQWDPLVLELVASARAAIEEDPSAARRQLDRLAALLGQPSTCEVEEAFLLPAMPKEALRPSNTSGLAPWQLRRALAYMETHLGEPVSIPELAAVAKLSSSHFCRAFRLSVGESPHAHLVRQRIRRAQTLMLTSDDTLCQIAGACGLADQAHLTKLFRRLVGETPLAWRRARRRL